MKESGEMYLENIFVLSKGGKNVRAIDVAESMGFSKASVSRAFSKLKKDGCISVDENGFVILTTKGREIAGKIYERHQVLSKVLMSIGVSEENAKNDACKIEHDLSDETFEIIKKLSSCDKKGERENG